MTIAGKMLFNNHRWGIGHDIKIASFHSNNEGAHQQIPLIVI